MNKYFIHSLSSNSDDVELHHYVDGAYKSKKTTHLDSVSEFIDPDSDIFYFVPSSQISSIKISINNEESNEAIKARLLSDLDDYIVSDISQNDIFINRNPDLALLINDKYLSDISQSLKSTGAKIHVYPEHFIAYVRSKSSILKLYDRYIFSFDSAEGFSETEAGLNKYLDLLNKERSDYEPRILIEDKTLIKNFGDSNLDYVGLEELHSGFAKEHLTLPNLFQTNFSLNYLIKRFQINKLDIALAITALSLLVIYPLSSTYINNNYANEYKNETINLFKKINPNIKKVVNPRRQIDEIIKSYNLSEDNRLDISGIESIKRLDIPEITKVNLNVDNSEAKLTLSKLGSAQYKFLINILPQSNLVLLNEDIETKDGKVSGTVLIKFAI